MVNVIYISRVEALSYIKTGKIDYPSGKSIDIESESRKFTLKYYGNKVFLRGLI